MSSNKPLAIAGYGSALPVQRLFMHSRSVWQRAILACVVSMLCWLSISPSMAVTTLLSDVPIRSTTAVPANVMLALSVEWPTGVVQAHNDEAITPCPGRDAVNDSFCYFSNKTYIGYFDPYKCYTYNAGVNYFEMSGYTSGASAATPGAGDHTCTAKWSGNYLNWATMQTTDMFRYAMTGGDRYLDTATLTVLEKARHDGQGGFTQFPLKRIGGPVFNGVTPVGISTVMPLSAPITGRMHIRINGLNTVMWVHESREMLRNTAVVGGNNPGNLLTVPTNYVENGDCPSYAGGGICAPDASTNPGTRNVTETMTVSENGQCPSGTAGVTMCTNALAPSSGTRSVTRATTANNVACPGAFAGETSCLITNNGTRRHVYHETGTCATAPAGGTINACSNNNPSLGRRRLDRTEPGQCPTAVLITIPVSRTEISCSEVTFPTRTAINTESGQCPVAGAVACTNLTATFTGTRTVTITTTVNEPGQCLVDIADVPPVLRYTGTGTCVNVGPTTLRRAISWPTPINAYYVRTKTCDPAYPESQATCVLYGASSYKPEGLIQANSLKMRFGAFGYLRDNSALRDGGVLRARMKDVGPLLTVPAASPITNTRAEWSATDGTYTTNPDTSDAAATNTEFAAAAPNVTSSGVVQYLNRFGRAAGYKGFDPVAELYAETLKYMRNGPMTTYSPNTEYSSGATAAMIDGFPVITNWASDYPIQYSCQKNFIIGLADANAHKDKNLHGGIVNTESEPMAAPANMDVSYDGKTVPEWTDLVGAAEVATGNTVIPSPNARIPVGSTALSSVRNCCNGSAYLAGLAYFANVTDLRPDLNNLQGIQNIQTFYVDVREAGSWGTSGDPRNQLWLASKYGGFTDSNKNGRFDTGDLWADNTLPNQQGFPKPTNYFPASQPDRLVAGLRSAFSSILSIIGSASGVGLASTNISTQEFENGQYKVQYDTKDFTGDVIGKIITGIDLDTGAIVSTDVWNAQPKLNTMAAGTGWNSARIVVTANPAATVFGQPFRYANLSPTQQAALGPTVAIQKDLLNYIRGDKSREIGSGGIFRSRQHLLGDIVDSEAVFVAKPNDKYSDDFNPGYSAFQTTYATRELIVYAGSADGMLHAFNGSVSAADSATVGGIEKFAYVPNMTYGGPSIPATPAVDGLASIAAPAFAHHYMVNATPAVRDVDFARAGVDPTTVLPATKDWRTLLVGGMGKGGRGYYALDITNPTTFATEATMAANVLWEFTDEDMGYSYGLPRIAKTRKWGWVVIVTSGYNNVYGSVVANRGKGFLYVLNAKTGALLQKISTGIGTAAAPSGFAQINGYSPSLPDFTLDEVYGGDLFGNVWRFDFKSATLSVPTPLLFAQLTSIEDGSAQPITTSPRIEVSAADLKRYVFVGTGRGMDTSDTGNTQRQSMYVIRDGVSTKPYELTDSATGVALPAGTFPIRRADLAANTNLVDGLTAAQITAKPLGYFVDLGPVVNPTATTPRERIVLFPDASENVVTFVGNVPVSDTCNPNGTSNTYGLSFGTGKSKLFTLSGSVRTYIPYATTSALVKAQVVTAGGSLRILGTDQSGNVSLIGSPLSTVGGPQLMNWREILN